MTSTPDLRPLGGCDDPASVLGYARDRKSAEDQAAREVMVAGAKWASMHTEDSLVGPVESWHESCLPLGGAGCPGVADPSDARGENPADVTTSSTPPRNPAEERSGGDGIR